MISILLPTRGRLNNMRRLTTSVLDTADNPEDIEFIVYVDDDDNSYDTWHYPKNVKLYQVERQTLALYYNAAYEKATGPIYMLGSDDVIFHTKGWDTKVQNAFDQYSDKILLVYGDDGDPNKEKRFGTLPFIHKNWVEAVGRFLPPYFSGDFVDTWLNEMADGVGRKVMIDIFTEHMHPAFGKAPDDPTYAEKWTKHFRDDMPGVYASKADERQSDIEKLKKAMHV